MIVNPFMKGVCLWTLQHLPMHCFESARKISPLKSLPPTISTAPCSTAIPCSRFLLSLPSSLLIFHSNVRSHKKRTIFQIFTPDTKQPASAAECSMLHSSRIVIFSMHCADPSPGSILRKCHTGRRWPALCVKYRFFS